MTLNSYVHVLTDLPPVILSAYLTISIFKKIWGNSFGAHKYTYMQPLTWSSTTRITAKGLPSSSQGQYHNALILNI